MNRFFFQRMIVRALAVLAVFGSLFPNALPAAAAQPVVIAVGDYAPYHYWKDDTPQGLNINIIREAFELMGVPVRFERMPWKRSLASVRSGKVMGMCAGFKTPKREQFAIFPEEHLSMDENMVFTHVDSDVLLQKLEDLRYFRVGVTTAYSYGPEFDSLERLNKSEFIADKKLVRVLLGKRIDVAVGNRLVFPYLARQLGGEDKLTPLLNLGGAPLYLFFSRARGQAATDLAERFDRAMKQLRQTGRLGTIRNEYFRTIVVGADEWCPYNCEPGHEAPGYVIELLQRIFTDSGFSVEYVVKPWKRVLHEVRMGYMDAAVGAITVEAPDLVYPDAECGFTRTGLYRANPSWTYTGPKSLAGLVFGTAQGYSYGEALDGLIAEGLLQTEARSGEAPLETNIRMLLRGRIDGLLADKGVLTYAATKIGVADQLYFGGTPDPGTPVHVAFSPISNKSGKYAEIFSAGIRKLRRSGELDAILAKYRLTDWR